MDPNTIKNIQLLQAVQNGNHNEIKRLLNDNADPNFMISNTENGICTPLLIAVARSDPESVRILLDREAKYDVRSDDIMPTAWELALQIDNPKVVAQFGRVNEETDRECHVVLPSKTYSYYRRPGTSGISGQLYESKLIALVLLRLKEINCSFMLGSNLGGIGHFDDIVVRYSRRSDKKDKLIFLQAKHRKDPKKNKIPLESIYDSRCERGIFSMHTNFYNYLMVRCKFSNSRDEGIFYGNFEDLDVEFVLYTTTEIDFECSSTIPNSLLITSDYGIVVEFSENEALIQLLCQYADNTLVQSILNNDNVESRVMLARDFLKKFKIYCNQATEEEVGNIIMKKMDGKNPQLLYLLYHDLVQTYWRQNGDVNFLTQECDFLSEARKIMEDQPLLANLTEICYNASQRYQMTFTEDSFKSLKLEELLVRNQIVNILSTAPVLSFIKIGHFFKRKMVKSIAFVDMNQVGMECNEIFRMFMKTDNVKYMVLLIKNNEDCKQVKEFHSKFSNSHKRLIVISSKDLSEGIIKLIPGLPKICDSRISLADVENDDRNEILTTKCIEFQGRNVKLIDLLGKKHDPDHIKREFVTGPILLTLLNNDSFEMAPVLKKQIPYYIKRCFKKFDKVDELKKTNSLYIMDETNEVENNTDLVVISDDKERYDQVCKEHPVRNVHWFVKRDNYYVWRSSSNSLGNLRGILKFNDEETHESFDDRVVIIAAEPGMGKSTMLTEIKNDEKVNGIVWIVRINLIEYTEQFKDMENVIIDLEMAKNFLFKALELSALEKKVFERCYNKENIILLIDGFDEIVPNYTHSVLELLKTFKNSKIQQMIVTTRDNDAKITLENQLKVFADSLSPLTDGQISVLLEKYWKTKLHNINWNQSRFEEFSEELIKQYSRSVSQKFAHDNKFISNPLHIEMIADFIQNSFQEYHDTRSHVHLNKLKDELNLSSLYKKFINFKFTNIYLGEKNSIKSTSLFYSDNDFVKNFRKQHMRLASCTIFKKEMVKILLSSEELQRLPDDFEKIKSGQEKKGFVNRIIEDKPQFTHQTFAEYFAAEAIWEALMQSPLYQFNQIVEQLLFRDLMANDKEQICRFLQAVALDGENKIEITPQKKCALLESFKSNARQCKEKSYGLHLSLIERFIRNDPTELLRELRNLEENEKLLLLKLSAMMGYWKLVSTLTEILNINFLKSELEKDIWKESPLCLAAENQNCEIVQTFLQRDYEITWLDKDKRSLFSFWLHEKNYSCIKYFLKHGISDLGKMYANGYLPLYEALRAKETPQDIIEMLLRVTSLDFFNKNHFPNIEWYLLDYDLSLTKDFLTTGFQFQQSKVSIGKGQDNQTWELYCDDFNRRFVNQRPLDIFSKKIEIWVERMEYLCNNGIGFHLESLTPIKLIYLILKILFVELQDSFDLEHMILKTIITKQSVQLEVLEQSDDHCIDLWINGLEKIDLSKRILDNIRTNIISAHENGSLADMNKSQILKLLDLTEISDLEDELQSVVSEITRYEAIGLLSDTLHTLRINNITKKYLCNLSQRFSNLLELMEKNTSDWKKSIRDVGEKSVIDLNNSNFVETVINCVNNEYGSLLHYAIFNNNSNITEVLLNNQAHPNIKAKVSKNERLKLTREVKKSLESDVITPMHVAAALGNLEIVKMLVKRGANINFQFRDDLFTPLHMAACEGHTEVVKYMVEQGAAKIFENVETPLVLAKRYNRTEVIKILTPRK